MNSLLRTDIGRIRKTNEDAAFNGRGLYILCDGMGGHLAGDVAANLAVQILSEALQEHEPSIGLLLSSIQKANEAIYQKSITEKQCRGMGTTLTVLWTMDDQALIAQIGDSRAYLLRGGVLRQCTHDHSMVAELVRIGKLTAAEARVHPQKNLVTRALGTDPRAEADIFEITRHPGDRWLLCSDGLTDQVTDEEIAQIMSAHPADTAADTLVSLALSRGGPDNITLLLIDDEGGGMD